MSLKDELTAFVNLYRWLGKPEVTNSMTFQKEVVFDSGAYDLTLKIFNLNLDRRSNKLSIDFDFYPFKLEFEQDLIYFSDKLFDKKVVFNVTLKQNSLVRFHRSFQDFISLSSDIRKLSSCEDFYILDVDFCLSIDSGSDKPKALLVIEKVDILIDKIKKISDAFDSKDGGYKAVIFHGKDGIIQPLSIDLEIDKEILNVDVVSFTLLSEILDVETPDHEKIMLLKTAICEVFEKEKPIGNNIQFIFNNWSDIVRTYSNNFDTYIRGISFSTLRYEVEERHLKYYEDLNSSLIDVSLKIAILPTTFSIWLFFVRSDSEIIKNIGFLVALVVMAILFTYILWSQKSKIKYLESSVDKQVKLFSDKYKTSKKDYIVNSDIEDNIDDLSIDVKSKLSKASVWIDFSYAVLWAPVVAVLMFIIYSLCEMNSSNDIDLIKEEVILNLDSAHIDFSSDKDNIFLTPPKS